MQSASVFLSFNGQTPDDKCRTCKSLAAVAQVVERRLGKAEVTGSSLVSSFTIKLYFKTRLEFTFARLCIACKDRFSGMSYFSLYYSKNKSALYDMFLNICTFIFICKEYILVFLLFAFPPFISVKKHTGLSDFFFKIQVYIYNKKKFTKNPYLLNVFSFNIIVL